ELALRVEPTHYWSLMRLGQCLHVLGRGREDFVAAVGAFTGCIMKRPDHALAFHGRARVYFKLGRYEDAVADCSKEIALNPTESAGWNNRAAAYNNLRQWDKAVADSSKALELQPNFWHARCNRGLAYVNLGQPEKAIADCCKAIA